MELVNILRRQIQKEYMLSAPPKGARIRNSIFYSHGLLSDIRRGMALYRVQSPITGVFG